MKYRTLEEAVDFLVSAYHKPVRTKRSVKRGPYRISRLSLRRFVGPVVRSDDFLDELADRCLDRGIVFVCVGDFFYVTSVESALSVRPVSTLGLLAAEKCKSDTSSTPVADTNLSCAGPTDYTPDPLDPFDAFDEDDIEKFFCPHCGKRHTPDECPKCGAPVMFAQTLRDVC